jgi:Arc/MetJ-type ribon-helix-helix transcriptional regulator
MQAIQGRCRSTSFALTPEHLAWLDARRQHGAISRSAALRQALDELMASKTAEHPQHGIQP